MCDRCEQGFEAVGAQVPGEAVDGAQGTGGEPNLLATLFDKIDQIEKERGLKDLFEVGAAGPLDTGTRVVAVHDVKTNDANTTFVKGTPGIIVEPDLLMGLLPGYRVIFGNKIVTIMANEVEVETPAAEVAA